MQPGLAPGQGGAAENRTAGDQVASASTATTAMLPRFADVSSPAGQDARQRDHLAQVGVNDTDQRAAAAWAGMRMRRVDDETAVPAHPQSGEPVVPAGCADCGEGGGVIDGTATHYGESYNGRPLGCGTGSYSSLDAGIVAVSSSRYLEWPCGTVFRVCGAAGCVRAIRQDACPGCGRDQLDLSETGIAATCGEGTDRCSITIEEIAP